MRTRTYTVEEDDSRLPWQLAGEPDIKLAAQRSALPGREMMIFVLNCKSLRSIRWSWCFKPRDEMGKDLAMCLEQFWRPVWTPKLQAFFFIWVIYKLSMSDVSNVVGMPDLKLSGTTLKQRLSSIGLI